jgi:hypothetical protein
MHNRRAWRRPFWRGALPLALLLSTTLQGATSAAAQSYDLCSLFSTDAAAHLLGGIIDTRQYAEADQWRCAQYAQAGEAILDLQRFGSAEEASAFVTGNATGGEAIAGLGDASSLVRSDAGHQATVLWVVQGPWVVVLDVERDLQGLELAADDLTPVAQSVLDNLPGDPPASAQDGDRAVPPVSGRRIPAETDPCSVLTDDEMRAALAAVSPAGVAGVTFPITHTRIPLVEEAPTDVGAANDACKFVWGGNSTLVVLVTREWFDFMATSGGKPAEGLGGDQAIGVGEVPYVLNGDMAVLAETGGSGGTLRLHREVVKRAAAHL